MERLNIYSMLEIFLYIQDNKNNRNVVEDQNLIMYRLMPSKYNTIQIRITLIDEDGKILDFSGERFTITFTIESSQKMNLKSFLDKYGTETSNNFQLLH